MWPALGSPARGAGLGRVLVSAVSCQINGWVDTSCQLSAAIMQWCSSWQAGLQCSAPGRGLHDTADWRWSCPHHAITPPWTHDTSTQSWFETSNYLRS